MTVLHHHEWAPGHTPPAGVAVLVHGIGGWWRTWWRVGPALADRGWRVIAVDLRGHGSSARIEGVFTGTGLADDLGATIDSLRIGPVDLLLGHSLGAAAVLELAHARPEVARRLVLEDPPGSSRVDDVPFQTHLDAELRAAAERPEEEIRRGMAENPAWLEEDARQNVEGQGRAQREAIIASLRAGTGLRVAELVPQITIPALYLLAEAERSAIRGEQRERLVRGVPPGSSVREFRCGHTIHRDRFDEYVAAVLGWLA